MRKKPNNKKFEIAECEIAEVEEPKVSSRKPRKLAPVIKQWSQEDAEALDKYCNYLELEAGRRTHSISIPGYSAKAYKHAITFKRAVLLMLEQAYEAGKEDMRKELRSLLGVLSEDEVDEKLEDLSIAVRKRDEY